MEVDQQSLNCKCWGTGMSIEGRKVLSSNSSGGSYQQLMLFFFLFCSRVLKIDSLTNAYGNSVVLNKKQHLYYCSQAFSNRYDIRQ